MAAAYVQGNKNSADSGTSITVTLSGVTAGNLICLFVAWNVDTTATASDGTDSLIALTKANASGRNGQLFYLLSSSSGNKTYTVSFSESCNWQIVWVMEFSGGTWTLDGETSGTGTGTAATSGDISTTGADGIVVYGTKLFDTAATTSAPLINGVTPVEPAWSPIGTYHHQYYRILTAPFTNGSGDLTYSTSTNWVNNIAAFKSEAGGGGRIEIQDKYSIIQLETAELLLSEDANRLLTEAAPSATTDDILLEDGTSFLLLDNSVFLSGTSTGQSGASAAMRVRARFVGTSTGQSAKVGALRIRLRYAGSAAGQSAQSSAIRARLRFVGASAGQSADSAYQRTRLRLGSTSVGQSTASATLTVTAGGGKVYLTGESYGQSAAAATMRVHWRMQAASAGQSAKTCILTIIRRFTGASAAQSAQTSKMRLRERFAAASAGQSADLAALRMRWRMLGASAAQSTTYAVFGTPVVPAVPKAPGGGMLYRRRRQALPVRAGELVLLYGRSRGWSTARAWLDVDNEVARTAAVAQFKRAAAGLREAPTAEELEIIVALLMAEDAA
jgi:hypothetical protein